MFKNHCKGKFLILLGLLLCSCFGLDAQRNTYSPYSRYAYGILQEPIMGQSVSMGGTSYGLRSSSYINPMNPASYSAIDSLTFLFDFSFSGNLSQYRENDKRGTNLGYSLDHFAMKFPLTKHWGMAMGLYEYSKVGYQYGASGTLAGMQGEEDVTYIESYSATGGLNNLFIGTSVSLFDCLSLGVNWNYKFGNLIYTNTLTYSNSLYKGYAQNDLLYLSQSNFDFGLQFFRDFGEKHHLVLGATYTLPQAFKSELSSTHIVLDTLTLSPDADYSFSTPQSFGAGLSYTFDDRLTLAFDYAYQAWADADYYGKTDTLASTQRFALGLEYLPAKAADYYYQVIKYRMGLQYSDSYINFAAGNLKDIALTFGAGLPLKGQRSVLNVAFEIGKTLTPEKTLIKENYYKLSVSVAFSETWFMKRRFN